MTFHHIGRFMKSPKLHYEGWKTFYCDVHYDVWSYFEALRVVMNFKYNDELQLW